MTGRESAGRLSAYGRTRRAIASYGKDVLYRFDGARCGRAMGGKETDPSAEIRLEYVGFQAETEQARSVAVAVKEPSHLPRFAEYSVETFLRGKTGADGRHTSISTTTSPICGPMASTRRTVGLPVSSCAN